MELFGTQGFFSDLSNEIGTVNDEELFWRKEDKNAEFFFNDANSDTNFQNDVLDDRNLFIDTTVKKEIDDYGPSTYDEILWRDEKEVEGAKKIVTKSKEKSSQHSFFDNCDSLFVNKISSILFSDNGPKLTFNSTNHHQPVYNDVKKRKNNNCSSSSSSYRFQENLHKDKKQKIRFDDFEYDKEEIRREIKKCTEGVDNCLKKMAIDFVETKKPFPIVVEIKGKFYFLVTHPKKKKIEVKEKNVHLYGNHSKVFNEIPDRFKLKSKKGKESNDTEDLVVNELNELVIATRSKGQSTITMHVVKRDESRMKLNTVGSFSIGLRCARSYLGDGYYYKWIELEKSEIYVFLHYLVTLYHIRIESTAEIDVLMGHYERFLFSKNADGTFYWNPLDGYYDDLAFVLNKNVSAHVNNSKHVIDLPNGIKVGSVEYSDCVKKLLELKTKLPPKVDEKNQNLILNQNQNNSNNSTKKKRSKPHHDTTVTYDIFVKLGKIRRQTVINCIMESLGYLIDDVHWHNDYNCRKNGYKFLIIKFYSEKCALNALGVVNEQNYGKHKISALKSKRTEWTI